MRGKSLFGVLLGALVASSVSQPNVDVWPCRQMSCITPIVLNLTCIRCRDKSLWSSTCLPDALSTPSSPAM